LGIRSAYHELTVCLIQDVHLITALEEERLSRFKHGKLALVDKADELPEQAIAI
jgi:predicted NodU family carbamoyl transferase